MNRPDAGADNVRWRADPESERRLCSVATWLLAGILASGCALTDLTLNPPPHGKVTAASQIGAGREILLIVPFADRRTTPERCGMKKNGWNMDTADIHCSAPPGGWLAQLLAEELRAAGFRVGTDPREAGSGALRLDGVLSQFFVEPKADAFTVTPEADIALRLVATSRSGLHAHRRFYMKGRQPSLFGFEENFRLASEAAVRQMLARVVEAVAELVRQYPQLGQPPPIALSRNRQDAGEMLR